MLVQASDKYVCVNMPNRGVEDRFVTSLINYRIIVVSHKQNLVIAFKG